MSLIIKIWWHLCADADRMKEVADHVKKEQAHGHSVVLVVSAMGKETITFFALPQRYHKPDQPEKWTCSSPLVNEKQ